MQVHVPHAVAVRDLPDTSDAGPVWDKHAFRPSAIHNAGSVVRWTAALLSRSPGTLRSRRSPGPHRTNLAARLPNFEANNR
jgi:hypothetical protein